MGTYLKKHSIPNLAVVVSFSDLGKTEEEAVHSVIEAAKRSLTHIHIEKEYFGTDPVVGAEDIDLVIYLGESSRFKATMGKYRSSIPTVFVKSTMEHLMMRDESEAKRYRMCMGISDIVETLARIAPKRACIDPGCLAWGTANRAFSAMDEAEQFFVNESIAAFRKTYEQHGGTWVGKMPDDGNCAIFLPMHDPLAATLVDYAIRQWPNCTVLVGDGMTQAKMKVGTPWPENVIRIRHWSAQFETPCSVHFKDHANAGLVKELSDYDSCGMLYGTFMAIDQIVQQSNKQFEFIGFNGPLGTAQFNINGDIEPKRLVVLQGAKLSIVENNLYA